MKKSTLKQLIKEVDEEIEKHPLFAKGFRQGEKDGYVKEKADIEGKPDIYQLGYKRGYKVGFWRRYGEKITKGLSFLGQNFGSGGGRWQKF